jgi:hypothetical protein
MLKQGGFEEPSMAPMVNYILRSAAESGEKYD